MATHSNTLAWKIPWKEEPGRLQSMGSWRVRHDWATSLSRIGEGNGNPLQCSCQENPRDSGAWWATIYGVTQSRTRLKWLSNSSSSMHMSIPRSQEESENLRVQAVPWGKVPGYRSQENSSLFTEDPAGPECTKIPLRSCSGDRSLCSENARTSTSGGSLTRYPSQCQGDTSVFLEVHHSE